jgi:hypothetical protein
VDVVLEEAGVDAQSVNVRQSGTPVTDPGSSEVSAGDQITATPRDAKLG